MVTAIVWLAGVLCCGLQFAMAHEGHSHGDTERNVCLIPTSAHGTNPASAVTAGFKVVVVGAGAAGIELVSRYHPRIYRFFRNKVAADKAEDLVQLICETTPRQLGHVTAIDIGVHRVPCRTTPIGGRELVVSMLCEVADLHAGEGFEDHFLSIALRGNISEGTCSDLAIRIRRATSFGELAARLLDSVGSLRKS